MKLTLCMSVCLYVGLSMCISIQPHLCAQPSYLGAVRYVICIHRFIEEVFYHKLILCMFVCLSVYLSVCMSVCLFVSLYSSNYVLNLAIWVLFATSFAFTDVIEEVCDHKLTLCLSVYLYVCLSICISVHLHLCAQPSYLGAVCYVVRIHRCH